MNQLGGRKFVLALLTLTAPIFWWCGHIADRVYSAVVIATVGVYIAGNV